MNASEAGLALQWLRRVSHSPLSAPTLADLDMNGTPELVISDISGRMSAVDSVTGKILWSRQLSAKNQGLISPLVGVFTDDLSMSIVTVDSGGNVYLAQGATGEMLLRQSLERIQFAPLTLAPALTPAGARDATRDVVIMTGVNGQVFQLRFEGTPLKAVIDWREAITPAGAIAPGLTVPLMNAESYSILYSTPEFTHKLFNRQSIMERLNRVPAFFSAPSTIRTSPRARGSRSDWGPALGDLGGDGAPDLVWCTTNDYVATEQWIGESFYHQWRSERPFPKVLDLLLADFAYAPGDEILIVQRDGLRILNDRGRAISNVIQTVYPITSAAAPIGPDRPREPIHLAVADTNNSILIYRVQPKSDGTVRIDHLDYLKMNVTIDRTLLVQDGDGDGYADIYGAAKDGARNYVFRISTGIEMGPTAIPWTSVAGHPYRTRHRTRAYFNRLKQQNETILSHIDQVFQKAEEQYQQGDWEGTITLCDDVLRRSPRRQDANRLRLFATIRHHGVLITFGTLLALAAISAVATVIFRKIQRIRYLHRAGRLAEDEQYAAALELYQRILRRRPNDRPVIRRLARLMQKQCYYKEDAIRIYESMCAMEPEDSDMREALAHAYVRNNHQEQAALEVCETIRKKYEPRHEIEAFLGRAYHKAGQTERALERLEEAVALGHEDEAVDQLFIDLHIKHRRFMSQAAPVFEKALAQQGPRPELLEGLCLCYIDGRRIDDDARDVYEAFLQQAPDHVPVMAQLAAVYQSQGDHERAEPLARRILEIEPTHNEALRVMAQSLISLKQVDEQSVQLIEQAVKANPDEHELILALAHTYICLQRNDSEAVAMYRNALKRFPDDVELNKAVAQAADQNALDESVAENRALLIESLERLIDMGQEKNIILLRLAAAYRDEQLVAPKTRRAYEAACDAFEDDLSYKRLLGTIYARSGKTDSQAAEILEPLVMGALNQEETAVEVFATQAPEDITARRRPGALIELGKHLARIYFQIRQYENALTLAESLMALAPDDDEIERIRADASLHTDRLESAVEAYRQILANHPQDPDTLANLAIALNNLQRMDPEAMAIYREALAANPRHPRVIQVIGRIHAAQANVSECIKAMTLALKQDSNLLDELVEDCRSFLRQYGDAIEYHWFIARNLIGADRLDEAIDELMTIYETAPDQIEEVIRGYEQVLARNQRNARAHMGLGILYRARGATRPARSALESAYQIMPDNADIQDHLIELYEDLIRETSDDTELLFRLGEICQQSCRYDKAISCFQKCAKDPRYAALTPLRLTETFMAKGMLDIALNELKKLPANDELKEPLYQLALRFEEKGDRAGARNAYHLLVGIDIDYKDAREKYTRLTESGDAVQSFEDDTAILDKRSDKTSLHRYELLNELGRGAMGIVYRAHDKELDDVVALKVLPENMARNTEAVDRFRAEARAARKMTHPNIVRIHDLAEEGDRRFISMEYIQGEDLKARIRAGGISLVHALKIARAAADALAYAHGMGVIHRDIKPANILLKKDGTVKVTDFGIAKALETKGATRAGAILGTPLYMSPEQIQGEPVDPRADIYSLGVMLYETITGAPPFSEGDLTYKHLNADPPPMRDVPKFVSEIVLKCMAKDRNARYANAEQLRDALSAALIRLQAPARKKSK